MYACVCVRACVRLCVRVYVFVYVCVLACVCKSSNFTGFVIYHWDSKR